MKSYTSALSGTILALALSAWAADSHNAAAEEAGSASTPAGACANPPPAFVDPLSAPHWNGWGVDPQQSRFQPAAMAQLAAADVPRLKLKWAFAFPDASFAFAQPTVVGGRVFIGSQSGNVYSLDATTGCTYWQFDADALVRAAITVGQNPGGWTAYVGDRHANVHALDAMTGKVLWTTHADDQPAARIPARRRSSAPRCSCRSRPPKRLWPRTRNIPAAASAAASLRSMRRVERRCGRATQSPRKQSPAQ